MRLSKEAVDEFKGIYAGECGIDLSEDEAAEEALRLVRLFRLLQSPLPGRSTADADASKDAILTRSAH